MAGRIHVNVRDYVTFISIRGGLYKVIGQASSLASQGNHPLNLDVCWSSEVCPFVFREVQCFYTPSVHFASLRIRSPVVQHIRVNVLSVFWWGSALCLQQIVAGVCVHASLRASKMAAHWSDFVVGCRRIFVIWLFGRFRLFPADSRHDDSTILGLLGLSIEAPFPENRSRSSFKRCCLAAALSHVRLSWVFFSCVAKDPLGFLDSEFFPPKLVSSLSFHISQKLHLIKLRSGGLSHQFYATARDTNIAPKMRHPMTSRGS